MNKKHLYKRKKLVRYVIIFVILLKKPLRNFVGKGEHG